MRQQRGLKRYFYKLVRVYVCARVGHRWLSVGRITYCRRCRELE